MLQGLDPAVAEKLTDKWNQDQRRFFDFVKEKTGTKEAHEWGKRSCKHCYGRGYTGILQAGGLPKMICRCAKKNYQKELQSMRVEFNATRDEAHDKSDEQAQEAPDRPEDTEEALADSTAQG